MPPSAIEWTNFFNLTATIAIVAVIVVMGAMVFFTAKYRERKGQSIFVVSKIEGHVRSAIIFAIISIVILFSVSVAGERLTPNARFEPNTSENLNIHVTLFQWGFKYEYPNNATTNGQLFLPANTTVLFNVTSTDVMHNFYLVEYKVSIDAIPGRYNLIWITTPPINDNSTLSYSIVCKELCGVGHTYMKSQVTILNQASFDQWLNNKNSTTTS